MDEPMPPLSNTGGPNTPPEPSEPTVSSVDPLAPTATVDSPKKSRKRLWLFLFFVVLILGAGGYYGWYRHKHPRAGAIASTQNTFQTVTPSAQLCAVDYGYLVCTDKDGSHPVRYDLPLLEGLQVSSLTTTPNQSEFVAFADGIKTVDSQIWLLDSKLSLKKPITIPSAYSIGGDPSLSNDGKSLFIELDTPSSAKSPDREIYQYTIATGQLKQLTTVSSQFSGSMMPQPTRDGHILYGYFDGSTEWLPYIMKSDGSDKKALPGVTIPKNVISGWGYDKITDMVYVYVTGSDPTGKTDHSTLSYGKLTDLLKGGIAKTVSLGSASFIFPDNVTRVDSDKVAIGDTVYSLTTGKQTSKIPSLTGALIGWLNTAAFPRSSQQQVQPYDHIVGLKTTTSDFQSFIEHSYDTKKASCAGGFEIDISGEVRDKFAVVYWSCFNSDGDSATFIKTNNAWTEVASLESSNYLSCGALNKYKFTKILFDQCVDVHSNVVANTNP